MSSDQERYREYPPSQALRPYVACFWTGTAAAHRERRILPDGCIDIIFGSPDGFSAGTIIGTMTRPLVLRLDGPARMMAVRFRPGGATPFLRRPACELTDSRDELPGAWRSGRLAERIEDTAGNEERIQFLESALLARLADAPAPDARVQAAASLLEGRGCRIDAVAAAVEASRQHLTRLFNRHVGVGPKQFARVARLQRLLSEIRRRPRPHWPCAALDAGYYDQAHMIAECRSLTGVTPTELAGARLTADGSIPPIRRPRPRRQSRLRENIA